MKNPLLQPALQVGQGDRRPTGLPRNDLVTRTRSTWRRLAPALWVGRADGFPIGQIERGRHFVAVGIDGVIRGRFDSLRQAMSALEGLTETSSLDHRLTPRPRVR